jgi:hypothetical protein
VINANHPGRTPLIVETWIVAYRKRCNGRYGSVKHTLHVTYAHAVRADSPISRSCHGCAATERLSMDKLL